MTFHKIIAGCEAGRPEAWRDFLVDYTPVVLQLTRIYMPGCPDRAALWRAVLSAACAENFKLLRAFQHQSEREFLIDLRSLLFEKGSSALGPAPDTTEFPGPTAERVGALVKGLPLLHQEILFLKLAGYSDATLEKIFRIKPAIAQMSLERLEGDYVLNKEQDMCLRPAAWLILRREVRSAKTEACPPTRQFVRIQDGQVGWYDKDPTERHVAECLHCLEAWTALREIAYWRRNADPIGTEEVPELFSSLPIQTEILKAKPLLKRMFG